MQTILDFLRQTWAGVAEAWGQLSANARVQIGLAGAFVAAFLLGVVFIGGSQSYVTLYDDLDPEDRGQILIWLVDNGYDYELADRDRSIKVPVRDRQDIAVGVESLGLSVSRGGSLGLEIFDELGIATTDRKQEISYGRALNGEAQRQLERLDYVRSASVLIRESTRPFFLANEQEASEASVHLDVTRPLSARDVLTVVSNVQAIGGANLSSNDIVVIAGSEMLHGPTDDEFARMAGDRSRHQTAVESYYTKKIEMALARLGAETVVMVSAEHDWSSVDTAARTLPGEAKVISLQETTSETTVTERPPEGAPGVNANPPYGGGADGEPTTKTETSEMIENSDYPETLTNTKLPPGRLVAMKVGIAVNGTEKPAVDADGNETGEMDYVPPPPELIATITSLAQHAVADATVADVITPPQISVTGVRFMRPTTVTAGVVTPSNWWQNSTVRLGGQLLLMLIAFFVIRSFMRRAMAVPGEEAEEVEEVVEVDHEAERRKRVAEEVERLSNEEPEAVASLLRTWMIEE